jgi:hypothetical protein
LISSQKSLRFHDFTTHNINDPTRLQLTNRFSMDSVRSEGNDGYATDTSPPGGIAAPVLQRSGNLEESIDCSHHSRL